MTHHPVKISRWRPGLKKLKTISIRQPWAWLIINGYKDAQKQSWAAKLLGPVLIHTSQRHRSKWFQGTFGSTLTHACRLPFKPVKD